MKYLLLILVLWGSMVQAQTPDSASVRPIQDSMPSAPIHLAPKKHTHLEVGVSYQSDNVYLGRKDSARLPYLIPAISYYHKSGFFATAALNYLKNSTISRVDLFTLDAGYMFTAGKYDGQLTASKYFYNSQSTNITSDIREAFSYQNGYNLGFIKPSFTATLNIGSKADLEAQFELSHTFLLFNDDLDLTPTVAVGGSTLHFYDYYRRRKYKIAKKNKPVQTGVADVTGSVVDASKFRLMDYEFTIPIEYSIGKCTFSFTPTWSIPVNAATIDVHTVRDDGVVKDKLTTESIGNTFYFTAGVSFLF